MFSISRTNYEANLRIPTLPSLLDSFVRVRYGFLDIEPVQIQLA
jgi:hypothetical protein